MGCERVMTNADDSEAETGLDVNNAGSTSPGDSKNLPTTKLLRQCLIVLAASFVYIPTGMIQMWNNVFATHTADSNNTISGHEITLVPWQKDLVASIAEMGGMAGYITAGYFVRLIGRKRSLILTALPAMVGSAVIVLAGNAYVIIAGRFLDGMSIGMAYVTVNTYVSEVSDTSVRGAFCMLSLMMMQLGSIFMVSVGSTLPWYYMSLVCLCLLFTHCLIVMTLHESPSYLATTDREERALQLLQRLRGPESDVHKELDYLKTQNQKGSSDSFQGCGALFQRRHLLTTCLLSGMFFINVFSGNLVLRVNATRLLQDLGLPLEEKYTTIFLGLVLLGGNVILTLVVDRLGRRRCLIASLSIVAASCASLGTFIYFTGKNSFVAEPEIVVLNFLSGVANTTATQVEISSWHFLTAENLAPLILLMGACLGQSTGIGSIVWVLPSEMFPTSLRSQGTGICMMIGSLLGFSSLQLYSPMLATLSQAGMYWLFSSVAFGGIFYVYFLLKETSKIKVG
ncbi:facilitated trehalose transporter Tret1-2 homolog [Macrobrachium nipponense]|uniref:facilitated trehalose transporter Tret1-2 homolog n=1 Tax=Macrobrachium nipponense TaxID=159736 RepID=UPI0030C7FEFE